LGEPQRAEGPGGRACRIGLPRIRLAAALFLVLLRAPWRGQFEAARFAALLAPGEWAGRGA